MRIRVLVARTFTAKDNPVSIKLTSFLAWIMSDNVQVWRGIPEISPDTEFSNKPSGRVPTLTLKTGASPNRTGMVENARPFTIEKEGLG